MSADEIKAALNDKIKSINRAKQGLNDVMPLTWKHGELNDENGHFSWIQFFAKIAGLLATILAIMMGAPFWFDILNKISNLRGTGNKPATTKSD